MSKDSVYKKVNWQSYPLPFRKRKRKKKELCLTFTIRKWKPSDSPTPNHMQSHSFLDLSYSNKSIYKAFPTSEPCRLTSGGAVANVHPLPSETSFAVEIHQKTSDPPKNLQPNHALEDKPWPTRAGPGSDLPSACRPHAEREESARQWLEAAGPEEADDHRGKARVLEKPTEVNRFDSKEINQNKEKSGQKLRQKTHQKVAPQPKSREVFCWETLTTTRSNPGKQKLQSPND
jgi:hypothetical protein